MLTSKRSIGSFALSLGGLITAGALFALIYFECLTRVGYVWVAMIVFLCEFPALALSIPVRSHWLGRAALALSSSLLVGMLIGILLVTPTSNSTSAAEPTKVRLAQIHNEIAASDSSRLCVQKDSRLV